VALGDYVLVHVGFALGKVDEDEALRTYKALEEIGALDELTGAEPAPPESCPVFPPQ
jgi:hydrogenase expression/formation protein HypC